MISSSGTEDTVNSDKTQVDHEMLMNSFKAEKELGQKTVSAEKDDDSNNSLIFGNDHQTTVQVENILDPTAEEVEVKILQVRSIFSDLLERDTQEDLSADFQEDPFAVHPVEHLEADLVRHEQEHASSYSPVPSNGVITHIEEESTQSQMHAEAQTQVVEDQIQVMPVGGITLKSFRRAQEDVDVDSLVKSLFQETQKTLETQDTQKIETQSHDLNIQEAQVQDRNTEPLTAEGILDTQNINTQDINTQNINSQDINTQNINTQNINTQNINTQYINTQDTQKIQSQDSQLQATQKITSDGELSSQEKRLRRPQANLQLNAAKQFNLLNLEDTQKIEENSLDKDSQFQIPASQHVVQQESETSQSSESSFRRSIPSDFTKSHRQVLNTQEEYENQIMDQLHEVIKTDDEEEVAPYEDSLFQHKIKRRKLKSLGEIPLLQEETEEIFSSLKQPEVVASSPFTIRPRSSPVKEYDRSIRSDKPEVDVEMRDEESSSVSSNIDDIDEDYNNSSSQEIHITNEDIIHSVKRKSKYVVDSQSQNPRSDITVPDETQTEAQKSLPPLLKETLSVLTEVDIAHEDSVWAMYNLRMYTGKIVHRGMDSLTINFSEGLYDVGNNDVFLLDIRVGDIIRIRSLTSTYVVTGLTTADDNEVHCIRGYDFVMVKKSRGSKAKEIGIPLSECFMELDQWVLHQQLYKLVVAGQDLHQHDNKKQQKFESFVASKQVTFQPTPSIKSPKTGCFTKMFFCITSIEGQKKEDIRELIEENGGILIDDNWNDLFSYETTSLGLQLAASLVEFSFGGMISNSHCRSAKYLQALALGWPVLADAFITDCVKNPECVLDWHIYLLPAGQSLALNSIKSIDVYKFRLNYDMELDMSHQLGNNCHLLKAWNIIVLNQRNSTLLETCRFVFHCFGALSISYCSKVSEIANAVENLPETNVLVYDDGDVLKKLRKTGKKVRVINWEWVVQCVISGYIWDQERISIE